MRIPKYVTLPLAPLVMWLGIDTYAQQPERPPDNDELDLLELGPPDLTADELKALDRIENFLNDYCNGVFDYRVLKYFPQYLARDSKVINEKAEEVRNLGGLKNRFKARALENYPYNLFPKVTNKIEAEAMKVSDQGLIKGLSVLGVDPKTVNGVIYPPKSTDLTVDKLKQFFYDLNLYKERTKKTFKKFMKKEDRDQIEVRITFPNGFSASDVKEIRGRQIPHKSNILVIKDGKVIEKH